MLYILKFIKHSFVKKVLCCFLQKTLVYGLDFNNSRGY